MVHNHSHNRLIVLSEFTKIDPAGLLSIKYDMSKEIERRFNWLIEIINAVFEKDILKLNKEEPLISNASSITEEAIKKLQEQAFDFNTSEKKVEGFMDWLEDMEDLSILEKTTRSGRITAGTKRPWSDVYVQSSYQKGIYRARREMESAGVDITKLDNDPNREVDILFNKPFHADRCFVDARVPIFTSKGWKKIKDIKVGDLVLTHRKRFRKVTKLIQTPKQLPNVVNITLSGVSRHKQVSVTYGHPFLVNGNWKSSEKIEVGDKISYLATTCKTCGKTIPFSNDYCSNKCVQENENIIEIKRKAAKKQWAENGLELKRKMKESFNNGTRDRYQTTKKANERTREIYKSGQAFGWRGFSDVDMRELQRKAKEGREKAGYEGFKNKELRERASRIGKMRTLEKLREGTHPFQNPDVRRKALQNSILALNTISKPELIMGVLLSKLKVDNINSYEVNTGENLFYVDYALPEFKLFIEVDGIYWHKGNEEKDKKREKEILKVKKGWSFLRFTDEEVLYKTKEVYEEIIRVLFNHSKKYKFIELEVKKIKKHKVNWPTMLFNFSVEEDESYIANGFVVHNCAYLYTRTFNELKGITKEMDRQLSNILSQGIVDGKNGKVIAKEITSMIPKIGINRARTIARTEIQRAHHQANINEYMNAQIQGVVVLAEWENGANPCPICSSLSGEVFTLEKIRGLIPQHPNCFIDYQVPIYTSKGWKRIGDIVIGDYVLTHKGRFKKVTRLYKEKGQSPETIKLTFDTGNNKTLTLTSEHPILINGNWINAKDVKVGDEVQVLAGECKRCGKKIQWDHKYCSRTCLSLDITDKQWSDPKHRKHMSKLSSKRMKQAYADGTIDKYKVTEKANIKCRELVKEGKWILQQEEVREKGRHLTNTPLLRKLSSIRMKEENPMFDSVTRNRVKKSLKKLYKEHPEKKLNTRLAIMRWNGEMNSLEKQMADLLDKIGIKYEYQYKVLNYYIDFAIPELKIAIEVEGNYWHKGNEVHDKKRQTKIEGEGWFVLRYSEDKIKECKKEIKHELKRVLMNHKGEYSFIPLKVIKTETFIPKKKVTLYNFAVDKDESYIAKGFVVHNCVCVAIPFQPGIDSVKGAVPSVAGWLPNCSEVMHDVLPSTLQRMNMYVNAAKSCLTPVDKKKVEKAIKKNPPIDAKTREKLLIGEKILEFTPKNPLFEDQYKKYVKEINTTWVGKDRKYIAKRAFQEILADVFGDNKANGRILFGKENDIKSVISFTEQNHFKNKEKYFYIDYVATKEKGYGLKSMMQVATEAEKTGKGIYLQSAKDAIGFYKKLGMFEEVKDDLNYFTFTPSQVKSFTKKFKAIYGQ